MPQHSLSLIICTRDRADQLARCLAMLPLDEMVDQNVELIVVDNASQDETPSVIEEFSAQTGFEFKVLTELTPGLSRARNAGLNSAESQLIAFTDDDCYLGEGYIATAIKEFEDNTFDYGGGRILLYDQSDAPICLSLSECREVIPPRSFVPTGQIQGSNMVIRRKVFDKIGNFDIQLGPGAEFRCDDVDLIGRASMAGFCGVFIPSLVVYHHHGRKEGHDRRNIERLNDLGRGAYYAKFAMNRNFNHLLPWFRRAIVPWRLDRTIREIRGAVSYYRGAQDGAR